jgi:hypothetical protein
VLGTVCLSEVQADKRICSSLARKRRGDSVLPGIVLLTGLQPFMFDFISFVGLGLNSKVLHCLSHTSSPCCSGHFWRWVLMNYISSY